MITLIHHGAVPSLLLVACPESRIILGTRSYSLSIPCNIAVAFVQCSIAVELSGEI